MNIQTAAAMLDRTERAVSRYVKQGKLSARKVKVKGADNKTREVLDFDEAAVKSLKDELDSPSKTISPQVQRLAPPAADAGALVPLDPDSPAARFLTHLFDQLRRGSDELRAAADAWPVWMTRKQALELAGLAPSWLAAGVKKGELPFTGTRHTRRFHRDDLRAFAERVKDAGFLKRLLTKP